MPATESYFDDCLFEQGIGTVAVCRRKSGGRVETGVFLVDIFCLGVKNAFFETYSEAEFADFLAEAFESNVPAPRPGASGRKLVEGAVAYAKALGFLPHPDFKKGARVFGGIDPADCAEPFAYGKDGKPFYTQGPAETRDQAERILSVLTNKLGPDGFDYIVSAEEGSLEEEEWEEDEEDRIYALDSHADEDPAPDLIRFAEEFLNANSTFSDAVYSGPEHSAIPAGFLRQARAIQQELPATDQGPVPLEDILRILQFGWNLEILPPEDRATVIRESKLDSTMMAALLGKLETPPEYRHMIRDLLLANADRPGHERLLMLIEPV